MTRLKAAPPWDLVVFDEAHHLTAYRQSGKVVKTENYKLAEVLKDHSRDLLLLSATPHQGDHFRFWMLVQLLDPTLFNTPDDMVENRHRLNTVIFRRTKADACRPDGSTLFARRWVHTESFVMSELSGHFMTLQVYLKDGFALAKRQGKRAGFGVRDDDLPEDRRIELRRRAPHAAPPTDCANDSGSVDARPEAGHRSAQRGAR